jgi:hypothetical protein
MFDWNPVHWAESGASAVGHAFNDARKFVQDHWVEIAVVVAAVGVAACVATVACATAAIGMLGELSPTAAGWLLGAGGAAVATEEGNRCGLRRFGRHRQVRAVSAGRWIPR